jgi:hypothetical protein
MPRALEIPIEVTRLDRAVDSVRQFSGSIRNVGTASETAAERASRSWGQAMQRIGRDQERYLRVSGPAQRLQRATLARDAALATGDEGRIFDANAAVARATVGLQRARRQQAMTGGGSFMDRAIGVLSSTRVNLGGASPLIGQTARLLGIPMTGAAGLGFAGATLALGAFVAMLHTATQRLGQFGDAMRLSGGTAADVAGIGRFGFRGEAGAGAAEGFRQRIATDPMAQMFAARLGIRALPEPFGTVNNAALLNRAAEGLRRITDGEERLRAARVLGLESALRYIDVSPRLSAILDAQATFEERLGKGAQSANELAVATETLSNSWQDLMGVLATPVIEGLADDLQSINEMLHGDFSSATQDKHAKALEDHTRAMREHADAMKAFFQPGQYGGGHYSQNAMPTGWSGDFLARQMESGALSKGIPGV